MNRQLVLSILLFACLAGCSEDDIVCEEENSEYYGEADLLVNGRSFAFGAVAGNSGCNENNLTLNCVFYDETGLARMSLGIGNFPNRPGTYELQRRNPGESECALDLIYASFSFQEGDAVGPGFRVIEEPGTNNELIITHYDSLERRLEGRFSVSLAFPDPFPDGSVLPDTVRITYGTFSTEVLPPSEVGS